MIAVYPIQVPPAGGLNNSDPAHAIGDTQAVSIANLRPIGLSGLESIRPSKPFYASVPWHAPAGAHITDDVIVFRRSGAPPTFMFASGGKVYSVQSEVGEVVDIGYTGTPTARIRLVQFQDNVFIFNGVDRDKRWTGTHLWNVGIVAPSTAPTVDGYNGTKQRTYVYTYLNSIDGTESNPSPAVTVGGGGGSPTMTLGMDENDDEIEITVRASTDEQVDKIVIYRTGEGITIPRLCMVVDNANATVIDTSSDADVAMGRAVRYDRDPAPVLSNGVVHNNRLFAWGDPDNLHTVWVSNEYEPQYFPKVPFVDKEMASSGGPIQINPGDGSRVMAFAPWGGAGIAFKEHGVCYRILETEFGYYSYQVMMIPGLRAERSVQLTPSGLVWLSQDGWMLLDFNETVINFGSQLKEIVNDIDDFSLVSSCVTRGVYLTAFRRTSDGEWRALSFIDGAWQGTHTTLAGSSYYTDIDGELYIGRVGGASAGIDRGCLHMVGFASGAPAHKPVEIAWIDKAREYFPGAYSRIRKCVVYGRVYTRDAYRPTVNLTVRDDAGNLLTQTPFLFPSDGAEVVWLDAGAVGPRLSIGIEGDTTRAIRITILQPYVERVGENRGI